MRVLYKFKFLLIASLTIFMACNNEDPAPTVIVEGIITNSTDRPVENAAINIASGGTVIGSVTTDSSGKYTLPGLAPGDYSLTITSEGYNEVVESITLVQETLNVNKDYTLLGSANITGQIINSQTGGGLSNAQVSFYFQDDDSGGRVETDTSEANADLVTATDFQGNYSIDNAPTGTFVCVVRGNGFTPRVIQDIQFNSGSNPQDNTVLVEELSEGAIRIVLTWGENPFDLDSHLTGPDGVDRFHMYFVNQNPIPSVNLDVDDVFSFGPETTTISTLSAGTYRYSVHNYSDQSTNGTVGINSSPTQVEVYDENGLVKTYTAPTASNGDGNTWRVFEVVVDVSGNYQINDVNTYINAINFSDIDNFRTETKIATFHLTDF